MANSGEHKTAKQLMKGVSDITFEPYGFGRVIADDNPIVQARVMTAFLGFIYAMASKMDTDDLRGANADAIITAARIRDALEVYRTD